MTRQARGVEQQTSARWRAFADPVLALGELVLPRSCAGCGVPAHAVCPVCLRAFGDLIRCDDGAPVLAGLADDFGVWTTGGYERAPRHVMLAWKSAGRDDVGRALTALFARRCAAWAAMHGPAHTSAGTGERLVVVPAPSAAARRRRGRFVVGDLADAAASAVATTGAPVAAADVLRRRGVGDHGLSARARVRDRRGSVHCLADLTGAAVLLVDDVVTTGATLAACREAVMAAGATASGALTLLATTS